MKKNGETLTPETNPVLEAYLNGEYQHGLDVYSTLQPNAEASVWAGQCWFNLDGNVEALEICGSIARTVPGLVIPHLKDKRKYTVIHAGLRLNWDALEVKRALEIGGEIGMRRALALYTGPFLPNSQSEWAEVFRSELEFSVANLGLETVEDLYALERFEACVDLALWLLEVNILNVGVSVMLVKATAHLKGALAARETLDHILKSFERGLGVVPELLQDLRVQPGLVQRRISSTALRMCFRTLRRCTFRHSLCAAHSAALCSKNA